MAMSMACTTNHAACTEGTLCESDEDLSVQLLQVASAVPKRGGPAATPSHPSNTCAPLFDDGASFTVLVQIGTAYPGQQPQSLRLVADTGSNAMVVVSCFCNLLTPFGSGCELFQDCFLADQHVTPTLVQSGFEQDLAYGSGDIQCDIASDFVSLPSTNVVAYMRDGLFLVRDRHELMVGADFLGILGLGIPQAPESNDGDNLTSMITMDKLFMEKAAVPRYSVCFDLFSGGALKTAIPPLQHRLSSVGVFHWGVGVTGIRAGNASSTVACSPGMPGGGTNTPCGMIPDSGTTQVLGPADQVSDLFAGLCAEWPRCQARANASGTEPSSNVFNSLLLDCDDWLTAEGGLDEVPSIFFDLTGANDGEHQTIELKPVSWIVAALLYDVQTRSVHASSLLQEHAKKASEQNATVLQRRVCIADIGTMVYPTTLNGPIWILGQALFFSGTVSYDTTTYPPFMSFDMGKPCSCQLPEVPMELDGATPQNRTLMSGRLREVSGPPRLPVLDASVPL